MKNGKELRWSIAGGIMLLLSLLFQLLARNAYGFAEWYRLHVYPLVVGSFGRLFGIVPFSFVEFALYALIAAALVCLVRWFRRPLRLLAALLWLGGFLFLSYTLNCGINYHARPFSVCAGLERGEHTKEELGALCRFLTAQVNENASGALPYREQAVEWRREGVRAMQKLAETFPALSGFYPKPKEVTVSWILSVQQLCGVYAPFTVEANFNGAMPDYNIPHTICHELSHLRGFMREDEANFIGYLACIGSERESFRYSGYLTGWVYAGNALAGVDAELYRELYGELCETARSDLEYNRSFWKRYDGTVAEVSNQVNDAYLKANRQSDGVRSYGRMVDLMLAYYEPTSGRN